MQKQNDTKLLPSLDEMQQHSYSTNVINPRELFTPEQKMELLKELTRLALIRREPIADFILH